MNLIKICWKNTQQSL